MKMFLAICTFWLFALTVLAQSDGLTVSTQQGAVSGTVVTTGVRQFLGIPYATAIQLGRAEGLPGELLSTGAFSQIGGST